MTILPEKTTWKTTSPAKEIAAALETGEGRATRDSQTGGARTHYIARRLADGSVLRTACTQTSLARLILNLLLPVLWIVLLILVLCAAVSFRLARQITSPINQIDLDAPGENAVYPELRPLAARIREQNRTIRFQLTELSRRQQEFSAITEQMREGFLLLDANWDILSGNRSAKTLLALPQDAANLRGASLRRRRRARWKRPCPVRTPRRCCTFRTASGS